MPGPLELPPISTAILADVEQAAVDCGLTRDQMTEAGALAGNGVKGSIALHALRILHGFGGQCSAVLVGGERECPSGLEPDSGEPLQPTLKARTTLALGLPSGIRRRRWSRQSSTPMSSSKPRDRPSSLNARAVRS